MLRKLGLNKKDLNINEPIKFFVKPTPASIYVQHKKGWYLIKN